MPGEVRHVAEGECVVKEIGGFFGLDMDSRMKFCYCPPTTLLAEMIKVFQAKVHLQYAPGEPLNYEPDAYAVKLSNCAEAIVCRTAGDFVGGVWGYCNDLESRVAYISYIAKEKDAPKGLGCELHEAFRWFAIGRGMERVRLEVLKSNVHAQRFYDKLGYVCIEEREHSFLLERGLAD